MCVCVCVCLWNQPLRMCYMNFKVTSCPHFIIPIPVNWSMSVITSPQCLYDVGYFHCSVYIWVNCQKTPGSGNFIPPLSISRLDWKSAILTFSLLKSFGILKIFLNPFHKCLQVFHMYCSQFEVCSYSTEYLGDFLWKAVACKSECGSSTQILIKCIRECLLFYCTMLFKRQN